MTQSNKLRSQLARHNCAVYASEFLRGPTEPPYNGKFFVAEHHEAWAKLLNQHSKLCINAARDHGKSFFFTMAYPIWQAERHPGKKGFIVSGSQPQAERILLDIQQEIENNPNLSHLLPERRDRRMWSSKQLRLANGHEIMARGYGTKVRGAHPVWMVVDDGLNDEDAYSEKIRQRNINYFFMALRNMVIPGGQTIVVGTPYAKNDLYGELAKNSEWHFERYPAIVNYGTPNERALWPERYDLKTLYARRSEIGAIRFARELLCQPASDDMSLFPSFFFRGESVELYHKRLGAPLAEWSNVNFRGVFMGVDFGLSANVGSDFTVVFVLGVDHQGNRYVLDIVREHGLDFTMQKRLIASTAAKYKPGIIFVESNQAQSIFGEELMRETDLPVKHFYTGSEKHELEKGIPALRVLFENNKVRIPRGDDYSEKTTDVWFEEMRNMTFAEGRVQSTGEHDDTVMAFWICNKAIESAQFTFAFGEQEGDEEAHQAQLTKMKEEDEAEEDDDFMLGARPRFGRPRKNNAQLVDADMAATADGSYQYHSGTDLKPYEEVKPKDRIPLPTDLLGWRR